MKWCAFLLCVCFGTAYGSANSLKDPYICGSPSCIPSEKYNYSMQVIYKYDYKVSINTWFAGSTNNQSTLDVKSSVLIQFFTPCEGLLKLTDVSLVDQDENYPIERAEKFILALSNHPLRFAFHDGIISEICPEIAEEDWVLNFKRGVLSLFQSTMKRFDINFKGVEQDIHGTCNVDYLVRGQEGTSLIVIKSRDLTQCTDRYKYMSILQTVRYNFQSKFQTWPVLSSESKCRIAVDHKVYKSVNCKERHLFEPFSGKQSGAMTTVVQDLVLVEEKTKTDSQIMDEQPRSWDAISIRSHLMHHHTRYYRTSTGELKSARDVLKLLCEIKDSDDDSGPASTVDENLDSGSTVGLWGSLVRASRGLDHATLSQLLARAPSICPRATKHILDALPYIASEGSVELIKDMILKGVDEGTKNEWLMSMAMIPRPKLPKIQTMLELVQHKKHDKVISFTASSMVHSYCKHSGKSLRECCKESAPKDIMEIFEGIVVDIKQKGLSDISKDERTKVLLAIKALGNIGGFRPEFADTLMDIIGDNTVLLPLRLAAIDAFRRTPCVETREYFLEIYREDFVDVEVRLASYLQVMRCPNLSTIRKIFHALKHETVNQAATFVWSHLNNLGQSSLPSRVEIQGLLSGNTVPQLEDNPDFRMFSRNYEQSVFFDQYNAGGNYEANVIFTPDSYLPRSVSLNLTVDMFGESINILELKARGEGFEKYFEQVFGSYGALSKNRLNEYIQNLPRLFTRSINEADEGREKIDRLNYQNEAVKHQFPMAEIGLKVFGNEISYWSAEGDDEIRQSLSKLNPQMRILEILSGKEIAYNKASLFLDTTYAVPTGSGLPLTMNIMGTSYVNMKMSGTVIDKFSTSGNLDFEGKIHPSVALNVAATMGVIAGTLSSTGIRLNMRLYTATAVEAKLKLQGIKLIHLDLSLPHPKQEIFGAKSELIILHGDKEHQQMGLNQNRIEQNTCSWSTFDKAIGIKICAAYQFPNMENLKNAPYFLMSGPSKYLISLEKADPSAKTYSFHYTWDENDTASRFSFSFDTPNSNEKRIFNSEMILSQNSSTALISFQSAQSTLKAHGMYKNLEFDKSLEVRLDIDGRKHFDTAISLKRHDIKFGYIWIPHASLIVNEETIAGLSGSLKVKTKGGVTQWNIYAEFQTKQLASRLVGYYIINGPSHVTNLQLDYKFLNNTKHIVKFEGLYSEKPAGYRHDLYAEIGMEFSAYPAYNFFSVLTNVKSLSHLDIAVNISESRQLRDQPKLAFTFVRMDGLTNMRLRTELLLTKPKPLRMLFKYRQMGNKYNALALLNINPKARDIVIAGFLHKPSGTQLFVDASLNMTLPTLQPMYVNAKVHEKSPKEFQINTVGVWFTGVDFNIDALYWDQSKTNMASHRLKMLISSSHFKDIAADAKFTQDNRQITFVGDGEYNDEKYRALLRYILISEQNFTAHAEVDVSGKAYTVELRADLNNNTNINMDIHVDQLRDLHISYQRWVSDNQKRLSAAVNWDANRDPTQRVSVDIRLDHKDRLHHAGYITLYYPGRPINGEFDILLKDWFCEWHVRMGWSAEDVILWRVKMFSEAHSETVYALLSKMETPFPGWTDTSFNLMWRYHDNLQALNGSMNWQKDYLAFSLLADYLFRTNEFFGEFRAEVNSTIPTLPKAAAIAKHRVVWKKSADTLLSFQYNDDGILMINSSWGLDRGHKSNNITGVVTLLTPFPGYKKGFLRTKFVLGDKRDINGITFLDLEDKRLKIDVNGHMRRITNSMLAINVTNSVTEFSHMTARIGFIEADRHLVAIAITPNSTTGIEFLLQLNTIQDFHIFGHVALPIQYLTRAMVTAKRAKEEVDFRVGWDRMDFGFTGIWHYKSPINFVYLYKLYTPLEGFEENGIVLKNVYGNGLDTELSVRLSKHKFGIAILLKDKGKGILDAVTETFKKEKIDTDVILENFDTTAHVTLDMLYYPTVTFDAHVIKVVGADEEDIFEANATLNLPNKEPIVLTDVFILEEYTVMRNTLHLVTPYKSIQELKSVYTLDIILGEKINVTCLALLYNGEEKWHEISAKVFYEYETGADDAYQSHLAALGIVTPLIVLPSLDGTVSVRLEDSLWKMSADIGMPSFTINATGRLELDDPFVETSGSLNLTSPYLEDYFIKMEFKKDFSDIENTVGGGIQVLQGDQNNYVFADVQWSPLPAQRVHFKAKAALTPVLPDSIISLVYTDNRNDNYKSLITEFKFGDEISYSLNADKRPKTATVAISSPHKGLKSVKMLVDFAGDDISGSLTTDSLDCAIIGKVLNKNPLDISLDLIPKEADRIKIRIKSDTTPTTYALSAHFMGNIQLTLHAKADINDNFTDINFRVDSPQIVNKEIFLKARIDNYPKLRRVMKVQAATPFKELQFINADADFVFGPNTGYLVGEYEMPDIKGDGDLKWSFAVGDLFIRALGRQNAKASPRSVDLDIYFGNTTDPEGLNTTNAGFRMDLDKIWLIGANASVGYIVDRRILLVINTILPKPNVDVHTLRIDGDIGDKYSPYKSLLATYSTDVTKITTGVKGNVMIVPSEFQGNVSLIWTANSTINTIDNEFYTTWNENGSHFIDYALTSPLYQGEETFKVKGSYDRDFVHNLVLVKGNMHRPGSSQIGEVDIKYGGTRNTKGNFNLTTPFKNLLWLKSDFDIVNGDEESNNKINIDWPNKTASVNTTHQYKKVDDAFSQIGTISLEIPLNTKHFVTTNYYYLQSEKWSRGNTTIDFDHERFCKGSFKQVLSESERNLKLATTDIEVENAHTPVGIRYIHEYDGSGNIDVKQATIFHLLNASSFNVTGKVDVNSWDTGKTLKITAIHGERTLLFENDYESKDKEMKQGSKVKWADNTWVNYDVHITNMTSDETESQQIVVNVWYPRRTFNLVALYNLQDTMLDGRARLNWNVQDQNKTAELKGRWDNPPTSDGNVHNLGLSLSHPSFNKDITIKGQYITTPSVMSNISLRLQYSDHENEHLRFQTLLTDNSNGPIRDYKFALTCAHPATNLDLEMRSEVNIHSHWYYLDNYYRLQKTLFYEKLRHTKLVIDTRRSIVKYERTNETNYVKINSTWDLTYPDYTIYTWVDRNTGNDTGIAVLSMKDKSLIAHFNSTDDISYHMVGMIVDTRSAKLNAWRDYDDVTTVDVASYIRLNHSKLLTSSIKWRPEMYVEIKSQALGSLKQLYGQINESLVILKQAPMEAHLALRAIWGDAKPKMRDFLEDLSDLHVIKDDLDEFQTFLNESYESNDFYVKDIVEFVYNILDEMAIKNHLESLPGILNDVWGLMGNTGKSLKDSLTYVITKVKEAYANFLESVNKVLDADLMELLSEKLEEVILKYDNFVKDLHTKFLQYWETTWVNAINRLHKYWREILKSIEPMIFRILHFFETISINAWKNVMDFFYNRTQEITDSKYFNYVSAFGQELDHFYKDMIGNDLMTNIKKYTKKIWNTIWSKIEKFIPFQEEISSLYSEFKNAWDNFLKSPQVTFFTDKYKEAQSRLKWWYDYFYIGEAIDKVTEIMYEKLTQIAKTALIYEEEHRTPKTNFIFDPRKGEILLEQKLPMSWHAFNRTPDFSEIPEYKAVRHFLDDFMTTNKSLWHYINEFRPYLDMNNVLPPFGGMAMLTGQGTIVTFDKRVFTISQSGTFLLTKDYKENNFTVLMESNTQGRYNLVTLTKNNVVHIDLYKQEVYIEESVPLTLPAMVDECLIDRDLDTLTIQGQTGIEIQCNFLFKTCKIQISGWYYASVGGLFGTFNNELYDDMQLTNNTYTTKVLELGHSWNLEAGTVGLAVVENHETINDVQCDKFFRNNVSPLHRCFAVIDATPFYKECKAGVESCALASTYLEMCSQQHIPINIPEQCVQCTSPQGDIIEEGSFYEMKYVPSSTDIVFIVEAQFCNKNIRKEKNLDIFIEAFDSRLQGSGLSDNRYAVVGFGGSGIYKKPRSLYVNNKVFTSAVDVANHFDKLVVEKRDSVRRNSSRRADVFEALSFASTLPFRAAVSRTFILMPCTNCDADHMRLDYSTIHQNLMDNSITLHILMDDNLILSKTRASKYLFGIDNAAAYTNKDYENIVGDTALRKQVKLPKEKLGLCSSLAMETNGTIFSGKKLQEAKPLARRLSTVFGARAAQSARSCNEPAQCECREARLDCRPCSDRQRLLSELSSFWSDDIEDLLDMPPIDPMLGN